MTADPTFAPAVIDSKIPRSRPLLVRPMARFDCFGDGLCCTDIHALGPVTRKEKQEVELLAPGALVRNKDLGAPVFRHAESGACVLRSARGCELHAQHGAEAKPNGCSRFPFNLVATPEGGRVTTEHRCPCRTLGERPLITPESALPSLVDARGRLSVNGRVGPKVYLAPGKSVPFARFRAIESAMLALLLEPQAEVLRVLDIKAFGRLEGERWKDIAESLREERDGTSYGEAMLWCGNAIVALQSDTPLEAGKRPWSKSFDIAEQRGGRTTSEAVLRDWIADLLWSLDWVFSSGTFHAGRREIATLYVIARAITERLVRSRTRPDRAAAEAITMVELMRQSAGWERVQKAL